MGRLQRKGQAVRDREGEMEGEKKRSKQLEREEDICEQGVSPAVNFTVGVEILNK